MPLARTMREAAAALLGNLDAGQQRALSFPLDDDAERRDWHYLPRDRNGLSLGDLDWAQRRQAYRLVATGLSETSFASVAVIVALEDVLDHLEGHRRGRHAEDYAVAVFGSPDHDRWGWRFEGHHVSLHHTVVEDTVASAPQFLGANPARMQAAGHPTVEPLAAEDQLALALVDALASPDRAMAIIDDSDVPADILTGNARSTPSWLEPIGVPAERLGGTAAELLHQLVEVYLGRLPAEVAERERAGARAGVHFAWAGTPRRGEPRYYRIQSPSFLVEYDNTQDGANHAHSVWRSRAGDFGADLLRHHHGAHHPPPVA